MQVRTYGTSGPRVVLLHGGPGAPGYVAPVARGLAHRFRVLEPFQRGSCDVEPVTVARLVEDLHDLCAGSGERQAVVGHSWGAMLALCHAAAYPEEVAALVLIGCGTFDPAARRELDATRVTRLAADPELRRRVGRLTLEIADPDRRLAELARLLLRVDGYDLTGEELELDPLPDAQANSELWEDMARLQEEGIYPAAFAAIDAPVLMLHGSYDPHPGAMIHRSLAPHLGRLEYRELERCGHYPWLERAVGDGLHAMVGDWLAAQL